ncbi:MAG TPA: Gfo/Idh/MocA family oxidoreductase [Thermoleophilaceae bacterium]|nr:Gfo/Idh/MocA family oxidoreductase [Thermoleophilaceae bacterium]
MIIVDRALAARAAAGDPVRVAMVGAGFMGRGIARQIFHSVPGMELAAVFARRLPQAAQAYREAGADDVQTVADLRSLEAAVAAGRPAVTEDASLLCRAEGIDVLIEVTGSVEFGAGVVLEAIEHGKHVILMNAELDGTLGPLLKTRAEEAGVVYSASDGDQPGVQMNLFRFVQGIGVTPLVCGNIKGLHDPYRNPTTQEGFARQWGQNPYMVTSFADGTKISFEQATVANATGMTVAQRGMLGWEHEGHVDELTDRYDVDSLRELGGIVDYVVRSQPSPGVFVLGTHDDPAQQHYLNLYKLGEGPLYSFYTPYHLCHFEVPQSAARAAIFGDAVMAPAGPPLVEVVTTAKVDLAPGTEIDAMGGYHTYGQCEVANVAAEENLLPMGVAEGCRVVRAVDKDQVLTYDDVEVPPGRLHDELRREQAALFGQPEPLAS